MTPQEFFTKYNGKGIDYDNYYGFQCMDEYRQFVKEVLNFPQSPSVSGAIKVWDTYLKDRFDRISNSDTNFPECGDVIIWGAGVGEYGHIAICSSANKDNFISFDQNWPVGSLCHYQNHSYKNVLGWLKPKKSIIEDVITLQTKIPQVLDQNGNPMEVQAIVSSIKAKNEEILSLKLTVQALNDRLTILEQETPQNTSSESTDDATQDTSNTPSLLSRLWTRIKKAYLDLISNYD
jgi:hypothetical protein